MGGIHFVGVNAPDDVEELPVLSLLACETMIPLRQKVGRAPVVGPDRLGPEWLAEARRGRTPGAGLGRTEQQTPSRPSHAKNAIPLSLVKKKNQSRGHRYCKCDYR